ncbi:MAG TPA: AEC family transporter [Burkholderiales bacterium]
MLAILNVTAPFFVLILCGFLAARFRLLPENAVPALNTFVLWFALPCMLFRFAAQTPFGELVKPEVFLAYTTAGLAMLAMVAAVVRIAGGERLADAAFTGLAASWSNWGYMGFALIPAMLGEAALPTLISAGMADLFVVVSAALALASLEGRRGGGLAPALVGIVVRVAKNPMIWAVVLGAGFTGFELALWRPADEVARLLGDSAVPVALFTIGVSLYRPGTRASRNQVLAISALKLVAHPYLVAVVAIYLFHLPTLDVRTLALAAALPVGGSVYLFAERAGANADRIAASILVSTALAFFSFAALCWAFGVTPVG